jgi:hypothetical protein
MSVLADTHMQASTAESSIPVQASMLAKSFNTFVISDNTFVLTDNSSTLPTAHMLADTPVLSECRKQMAKTGIAPKKGSMDC